MREVTVGDQKTIIAATPITVYLYDRAFKSDLINDFFEEWANVGGGSDRPPLSFARMLQILWAMTKSAHLEEPFPDFDSWLATLDIGFIDQALWVSVFEEGLAGFFRDPSGAKPEKVITR